MAYTSILLAETYFDGTAGIDVDITQAVPFTWAFKVKSTQESTFKYLFDQGTSRFILSWNHDITGQMALNDGTTRQFGLAPDDDIWHEVVFVYTATETKCFVDGVQSGSTGGSANRALSSANAQYLGSHNNGTSSGFLGYMEDVRLYDEAIADADVGGLYSNVSLLDPTALKASLVDPNNTANLRAGLVTSSYGGGTPSSVDEVKRGLTDGTNLKPSLVDSAGNLKPGLLK